MSGQQQPSTIDLAIQHFSACRLSKAEHICEQILQNDLNQPVTLNLLGVMIHQLGKNEAAANLIAKAVELKPDYPEAHRNTSNVLQSLRKPVEAVASL